jgi:hypothetical protein
MGRVRPSGRIFIGSHSLPSLGGRIIGPSVLKACIPPSDFFLPAGVFGSLHKSYPDLRNAAHQYLATCISPNACLDSAKRCLQPTFMETPAMSVPSYVGLQRPSAYFPSPSSTTIGWPRQSSPPQPTATDSRGGARPHSGRQSERTLMSPRGGVNRRDGQL